MPITTAQYKAAIEAKIAAANGSTTLRDLTLIKTNADLWLSNNPTGSIAGYATLEGLIQTIQNSLGVGSSNVDLSLAGVAAFPQKNPTPSMSHVLGEIVELNPSFPPTIELSGMKFIKNGYALTSGYAPELEQYKSVVASMEVISGSPLFDNTIQEMASDAGVIIAVGFSSRIMRSTDSGATWTQITSPITCNFSGVAAFGGVFIAGGDHANSIIRSTNGGLTWSAVTGVSAIDKIVTDGTNWIMTKSGTDSTVWRSTNGGVTWANSSFQFALTTGDVAYANGMFIIGTSYNFFMRSTDGGLSWQPSNTGTPATCLRLVAKDELIFFGGQNSTNFVTINGGASFINLTNFTPSLHSKRYMAISGNYLYYRNSSVLTKINLALLTNNGSMFSSGTTVPDLNLLFSVNEQLFTIPTVNTSSRFRSINGVGIDMSDNDPTKTTIGLDRFYMRYL
jgi:photosystem II stability/assembly factor-like uncharacterized protein